MTIASRIYFAALLICVAATARAEEKVEVTPDVVYGHKHGLALTFDVFTPPEANGIGVLFMVSGGWRSAWYPPEAAQVLFQPLLAKGFTVFAVRHGSSPKFNIPEIVEDVRRSVRFVRLNAKRFNVDPEGLGVFGGSAGGHLSLMLGMTSDDGDENAADEVLRTSDRVAAVVAYYPPTDLRSWVTDDENNYNKNYPALKFETAKAGDYSPLLHVDPDDPPTLLVHGDLDKLVPLEHSEKIWEEMSKHKVAGELLVIEGAAHGFSGKNAQQASDALVRWFETHLLAEQGPDDAPK